MGKDDWDDGMNWDKSQLSAIEYAVENKAAIITGGAGTGKTTIIKEIVERLRGATVLAPTGKAAARLKEATGHYAETIHRCLQFDGTKFRLRGKLVDPVIVDEASMVDSWLMAALLSYDPPKIILVGDAAQLPPVGAGQPFHDLLAYRPEMVSRLTYCWRAQGAIHKAAQAIREGDMPSRNEVSGGESFGIKTLPSPEKVLAQLEAWAKSGDYDPFQDIMLAPRYGGDDTTNDDGGINSVNRRIQDIVNPAREGFEVQNAKKAHGNWRVNDRILCKKNFSDDDIWNGDLGTITSIDQLDNLFVKLDRCPENEDMKLESKHLRELTLAYCLSVHKSQGSQFRRVFFVVLPNTTRMLSRSMIYTGVTRAQKGCVIVGSPRALAGGIRNINSKSTVLQQLAMGAE